MSELLKKQIEQYLIDIKRNIPIASKQEDKFINDLEENIFIFTEENENCTIDDIISRFGTSQDIAFDYIEELDSNTLSINISTSKTKKIVLKVSILMLLFLAILLGVLRYLDTIAPEKPEFIDGNNVNVKIYDNSNLGDKYDE